MAHHALFSAALDVERGSGAKLGDGHNTARRRTERRTLPLLDFLLRAVLEMTETGLTLAIEKFADGSSRAMFFFQ